MKSTFNEMLDTAIGGPKSNYLLTSNSPELDIVTGNYGKDGRAMVFTRASVGYSDDLTGWKVSVTANSEIQGAIGRFFPPETLKKIKLASQNMSPSGEVSFGFVEPPVFFKPLIELQE